MHPRLTRIDELLAQEHHWLQGDEPCFFLREYTPGVGYSGSETNSLINNLKKPPSVQGTPQWYWKGQAIQQVARELRDARRPSGSPGRPWPMPPSKTEDHPDYEDRMLQVLRHMEAAGPERLTLDVRLLLRQTQSVEAAHQGGDRRNPDQLAALLEVDPAHTEPPPKRLAVVDDVLTTGAHHLAATRVLRNHFGDITIVGLSVARVLHRDD